MATVSHSALEFLRRHGLVDENIRPTPRLNVTDLLVHTVPMCSPPNPAQDVLRGYEGEPPPDRNLSRPWPGQP
jgi:hypothetical protein